MGAQLDEAYIFEGIGRAMLRQHMFIEDLSQSECLPNTLHAEGTSLGLNHWQFKADAAESAGRQTIRYLRLLRACEKILKVTFYYWHETSAHRMSPGNCELPPFLRSDWYLQRLQGESSTAKRIGNRVYPPAAQTLQQFCKKAYDQLQWPAKHAVEPAADQYAARELFSAGPSSNYLWRSSLVKDGVMEPPTEKPLRDFTKYVVPSVENVREDVIDTWRRLAIPALTLHLTEVAVKEQEN